MCQGEKTSPHILTSSLYYKKAALSNSAEEKPSWFLKNYNFFCSKKNRVALKKRQYHFYDEIACAAKNVCHANCRRKNNVIYVAKTKLSLLENNVGFK